MIESESKDITGATVTQGYVEVLADDETAARAQRFFADVAAETRKPHFGHQAREWVSALLKRAQEADLYSPEKP